jgi:hypothetical protein
MVKKKSIRKNTINKVNVGKNKKDSKKRVAIIIPNESSYKRGLLEINQQETKYDRLFEQKLAEQYREFRNLKEHHMQSKKFIRILVVLMTIVLIALLLLSYRV